MSETISDSTRLAGHQRLRGRLGHIVSLPFCLHYQPLWNGVGGVREGGGVAGLSSLFDHWSPWPCLKGLNLSWPYQGMYFFFFWARVTEWMFTRSEDAVETLTGVFFYLSGDRGMSRACRVCENMHAHARKVHKLEVWNLIRPYLSDYLTTGNHNSVNFIIKVYLGHAFLGSKNCRPGIFL